MLNFINAKINLGLNVVGKREDGYHLLETLFYPIGRYNGTPQNPEPFCDVMELGGRKEGDTGVYESGNILFDFSGNVIDCEPQKNLVVRAAELIRGHYGEEFDKRCGKLTLRLVKQIPDGAGMGGGSADATFTLSMLNELSARYGLKRLKDEELESMALSLGADCPVFVMNRPAYGEGIGEKLRPMAELLKGMWCVVVKPELHISTKEAFSGITPRRPEVGILDIVTLPLQQWKPLLHNDFEDSLFPQYPELKRLKDALYEGGAEYASMTGSGAALYGIFSEEEEARRCLERLRGTVAFSTLCLL